MKTAKSATIIIFDLLMLYTSFFGVFVHYEGFVAVPFQASALMLFVALLWFVIALNSSVASLHIEIPDAAGGRQGGGKGGESDFNVPPPGVPPVRGVVRKLP